MKVKRTKGAVSGFGLLSNFLFMFFFFFFFIFVGQFKL